MRRVAYLTAGLLALCADALLLWWVLSHVDFMTAILPTREHFLFLYVGIGLAGAVISWLLSESIADWSMRTSPYEDNDAVQPAGDLRDVAAAQAPKFGLKKLPYLAVYSEGDVNAYLVRRRGAAAKVIVSTGLLVKLSKQEAEGIIAHALAKIASGDWATLLLLRGMINPFSIFPTRMFSFLMATSVRTSDETTPVDWLENLLQIALEVVLAPINGLLARHFARGAERRADALAVQVLGPKSLQALFTRLATMSSVTATREMFMAPLALLAHNRRSLRLLSHHHAVAWRLQHSAGD